MVVDVTVSTVIFVGVWMSLDDWFYKIVYCEHSEDIFSVCSQLCKTL